MTFIVSTVAASVAAIIFVWTDIARLERRYREKDRLLDDQLAVLKKTIARIDEFERRSATRLDAIDRAMKVIVPFAEQLDKRY